MIRINSRRRPSRSGSYFCIAVSSASLLLLLLSLFVLHSHLSSTVARLSSDASDPSLLLLDDADNDAFDGNADDRIDVLDEVSEDPTNADDDDDADTTGGGYFWDHLLGVKRRVFGRRRQDSERRQRDDDDRGRKLEVRFASDDLPVDGDMRSKMASIRGIEDALLIKVAGGNSPLREGWAKWFEAKGRFLRQDKMFGSGMQVLNPMNHPLLMQDTLGGTGLTRGDRLVRKAIWKELEGIPFPVERRKALNVVEEVAGMSGRRSTSALKGGKIYADGNKRWGFYPGIQPDSSFSEFMDSFFFKQSSRCELRVFMVWNSPPWMYGVRHQRGLESLLYHNKDACVVIFSETMELDYFHDFVKDGFKVAMAMPNLDELLRDTPLSVFTSAWGRWRKTRYYPLHYSELIRLVALFKYGGIYLDSDVIVLKPLRSLENTFGVEERLSGNVSFNGAVMAFDKGSPFLLECMDEFYSTYDVGRLKWNGAELLGRVVKRVQSNGYDVKVLKMKEPSAFFPVSSLDIAGYFTAPTDEIDRNRQDALLKKILDHSLTFHLWNGVTSALVTEQGSLVERLLNLNCLYCLDVL